MHLILACIYYFSIQSGRTPEAEGNSWKYMQVLNVLFHGIVCIINQNEIVKHFTQ